MTYFNFLYRLYTLLINVHILHLTGKCNELSYKLVSSFDYISIFHKVLRSFLNLYSSLFFFFLMIAHISKMLARRRNRMYKRLHFTFEDEIECSSPDFLSWMALFQFGLTQVGNRTVQKSNWMKLFANWNTILVFIQFRSKLRAVIDHLSAVLTNLAGKTYTKTGHYMYRR